MGQRSRGGGGETQATTMNRKIREACAEEAEYELNKQKYLMEYQHQLDLELAQTYSNSNNKNNGINININIDKDIDPEDLKEYMNIIKESLGRHL